jgi:hypothetical protein
MSNTHEALKLAEEIDSKEWFSCAQAADTIRTQHALIVQMLEELEDARVVMTLGPEYDGVTAAIAAAKDYLK